MHNRRLNPVCGGIGRVPARLEIVRAQPQNRRGRLVKRLGGYRKDPSFSDHHQLASGNKRRIYQTDPKAASVFFSLRPASHHVSCLNTTSKCEPRHWIKWGAGVVKTEMSDQTTIIREIAEDVYKTLGSGFSEEVYDRAMQVGLRLAKIGYEGQKVVELKYKDHYVGEGYPDLVVHLGNEKLIVELKAISGELGASEEQQLRNYMNILNVKRGLLINFQQPGRKQGKTTLDIREVTL